MRTFKIVKRFSRAPGPRYSKEGMNAGDEFRDKILVPELHAALAEGQQVLIDLDGTAGYSPGFLDEAFGGLIHSCGFTAAVLRGLLSFKSEEEPQLISEIQGYINFHEKRRNADVVMNAPAPTVTENAIDDAT